MPDPSRTRRVCILGATSAMAEQTARLLAQRGDGLALVARNPDRLEAIAADLEAGRASRVVCRAADLAEIASPRAFLSDVAEELGGLDALLIFQGALGDQAVSEADDAAAQSIMSINFNSPVLFALAAAQQLEGSAHPHPVVLAVGSVAGDRGRGSNFVYGAAKGGLALAMQGLHHRLAQRGSKVRAVVVKPGFVDTPMTAGFKKGGPLWAKPEQVAKIIVKAMDGRAAIVYAPWFWRFILLIIRLLPQPLMNQTKL